MKMTMYFLLLLLVCSVCTAQQQSSVQQSSLQDIRDALRELTASVDQQKVEIATLQQQKKAEQVAFSASLLAEVYGTTRPFPTFTTLIFKNVVTNIGNSYDSNTGVFTAPVRGLYHFQFHIAGIAFNTAAVLVKNTNRIFAAYEHQTEGFGTASQSASLLLEVGDTVCVNLWEQSKVFDNSSHHTSFSGFLLFSI